MRYKVKINDISPDLPKEELYTHNCYLGISINNPFFVGDHLSLLLNWIDKRYKTCKIIVGDHLHRINEYIMNGREGEEAIAEGKRRGKIIVDKFGELITGYQSCNFNLEYWEQYYNDAECQGEKALLFEYYHKNPEFHSAIDSSCTEFIERQISRGCHIQVSRDKAIALSREYLLEEMAVFSILIERGYKVQVYPGTQLSVLKQIANGEINNMKTNLKNGIYIDLTVKKVK